MNDEQAQGIVFNIQKFSVHDGEGIRTLVFLKGCPLRCAWCSNPESQSIKPEHAFNPSRCLSASICGQCLQVCPSKALSLKDGLICFDMRKCQECLQCTTVCPSGAQTVYGQRMVVKDILDKVERDGAFFARSGGGLTLSGGEALMQHEFAHSLLRAAKQRHLDTCIETCGYYKYEYLYEACKHLDKLIMDIKSLNTQKHKQFTGVDNALILENFKNVCRDFPNLPILIRTPVIPGFNDTEADIAAIRAFIPRRSTIEYELLPYHRLGQVKYGYLGRRYALDGVTLDKEHMHKLKLLSV